MKTFPCLIFDLETTGIPRFDLPADHPSQPRMVQIAAALIEADGEPLARIDHIVRPAGWTIPEEAAKIHGITTDIALERGIPVAEALDAFMALFDRAAVQAAFGIAFDSKMLRGELRRAGRPDRYGDLPDFDVMRACTPLCKIAPTGKMMAAGRYTHKTPNLTEAAKILLAIDHDKAHTAGGDVAVTVQLYRLLAAKGLAKPRQRIAGEKKSAPTAPSAQPAAPTWPATDDTEAIF